ncbi:glycoside hydrolase family 30 protein [candidate division KSB1 bacterium]|nr:glycoside hydrolase family 30 protein [candidate division KSB1 bacterium]
MKKCVRLNILFTVTVFCFTSLSWTDICHSKDFDEAKVYMTARANSNFLTDRGFRAFEPLNQPDENYPTIMVDVDKTFQTIEGFGGAFTDASAITFAKLTKENQEKFLKASFDPVEGNGYTLCRTTIHSCDYSAEMYTYAEVEGDKDLKNFSIEHDRKFRIPFIKKALESAGGNIKIYASPWSPPAWMKTNKNMLHGGKLKPEYNQTWADYFVKYVKAYEREGIPHWGLTVQNEPMAVQVWESCIFTAEEERDFVRDFLGPTLKKNGLSDLKLMIWDHNRGIMYQRAEVVYDDPQASQYVWGLAFHYYVGDHYDNVRMVHDAFPDKKLIYSEAGMGGSWETGVHIAKNMIIDLNNWTNGWTFWNLLLDETRGPRHAGGLGGTSMVTADTKTGEVTFNPPYYYFGHFSRFIKLGMKRIACTSNNDDFLATAFVDDEKNVVTVILNTSEADRIFQVWVNGKALKYTAPPLSIITMVF